MSSIPFHIEMRRLYREGDNYQHDLAFGVVGIDEPARVVVISDAYADPQITERLAKGVLDLPDTLIDALAIKCFLLMADLIVDQGGESGWWTIPDITTFVRKQFTVDDCDRIVGALNRLAPSDVTVNNVCLVADNDAI